MSARVGSLLYSLYLLNSGKLRFCKIFKDGRIIHLIIVLYQMYRFRSLD